MSAVILRSCTYYAFHQLLGYVCSTPLDSIYHICNSIYIGYLSYEYD